MKKLAPYLAIFLFGLMLPAPELEIAGFTKLGADAPAIKFKKLTGTTASAEGESISVAHGVDPNKVLSITALVLFNEQWMYHIPPEYSAGPGLGYSLAVDKAFIHVINHRRIQDDIFSGSQGILSKPVEITIIYEE